MLYQLSREEVQKVCSTCAHFESLSSTCKANPGERKALTEIRKCKKWDEYFGGQCLYRGTN